MIISVLTILIAIQISSFWSSAGYCQSAAQLSENEIKSTVFVTVVSHFDRPWTMKANDLAALRLLTKNHPNMRWTHLFNPVAYTTPTPLLKEMESYIKDSRDKHSAEIGVHLHMYRTFVESAGVKYRIRPSVSANKSKGSFDNSGYSVPMTTYSADEITLMLDFTLSKFQTKRLGVPKTFCAGFYTTSLELQKTIADKGFNVSAAAFPPGHEIGAKYAPSWHELSGWNDSVTIRSSPYRVSKKSILPSGNAPFIKASDGKPLVEIPQNTKIDWMISSKEMKRIIDIHIDLAFKKTPSAVCLAIHESSAHEYFKKYDEVLDYIDHLKKQNNKVKIRYITATNLRDEFLQYWEKHDLSHAK